ncbi:MAG: hypothetical protein AB8G86_08910 [Saprospiraceae bacterium]
MQTTSKRYLILLYDNTLDGLLSAIFDIYRLKLDDFAIIPSKDFQETLFKPTLNVSTNKAKANRIKMGIKRKTQQNVLPYLAHFFDSTIQKEQVIYQYVHHVFQ